MGEHTDRQQRNMELIRRGFDAYAAGDMEAIEEIFSPDLILVTSAGVGNAGTYRGRGALAEWSEPWSAAWEEFTTEIDEMFPLGERHIVVTVNQAARGRDGIEVTSQNAFAYEVADDGLCTRIGFFLEPQLAFAAAREWGAPE